MKLQASSAFEPEACNLKSLITPETDSCSVAYALFTADKLVSRFRSSQVLAAPSDANFGIKETLATL